MTTSQYLTKPGKHGTLYRYSAEYIDPCDPGFLPSQWSCWAYDVDHAIDLFDDTSADDGFTLKSTPKRVRVPN